MPKIKRAIISVYDKKGIIEFARGLRKLGIEILASGGTCRLLRDKNISAISISDYIGYPEMLGGRVKTLHPRIHAGLLALDGKKHQEELKKNEILPLNMVVVNLYPFAEAVRRKRKLSEILENIDIGGVGLLRSGAKNFGRVAVLSSPQQYEQILEELRDNDCCLSKKTLRNLAIEAFKVSNKYDGLIAEFLENYFYPVRNNPPLADAPDPLGQGISNGVYPLPKDKLSKNLNLQLIKIKDLRYGENPHQKGALYSLLSTRYSLLFEEMKQLHGKELSYNNFADADLAYKVVVQFSQPAAVIVKHQTPCGAAVDKELNIAFQNAFACDKTSAFGGIVGFNKKVDEKTAQGLIKAGFLECIIASDYTKGALALLVKKKNLRILKTDFSANGSNPVREFSKGVNLEFKKIRGQILVQEEDMKKESIKLWKTVSRKKPTLLQKQALLFAWKVAKYVKSNAIVVAKRSKQGFSTVGIGPGQTSRIEAAEIALKKAGERSKGAVLASDGFFPFADSVRLVAKKGIKAIVQPGGSIRDKEVLAAADKARIAMLFTGVRHFRH